MLSRWLNFSKKTLIVRPGDRNVLVIGPSEPILVGPTQWQCLVVKPVQSNLVPVAPSLPVIVSPPPRGAWDTKGWTRDSYHGGRHYEGYFQVIGRHSRRIYRYRGRIMENRSEVIPYIANPPAEIKFHPKSACFILEDAPWFRVHWHNPANNVDDAILYIEKVLSECLN